MTRSRHLYSEFNEEADFDFGFTEKGLYIFCNSEKGLDSEIRDAEQANRLGVRTEVLSAEDVAERIPGLQLNRSEEHTSELQSRGHLVCRLLLEKKKREKKSS